MQFFNTYLKEGQIKADLKEAGSTTSYILNSLIDGVLIIDKSKNVISMNLTAERIFDIKSYDFCGQPIRELFVPAEREIFDNYLEHIVNNDADSPVIQIGVLRSDHDRLIVDLSLSKIILKDGSLFIVIVRDITQRELVEERLRQSQKLEAVGRLAGGIAHDFNNFTQAILGYTELLQRRVRKDSAIFNIIMQIDKLAEKSIALTRQLLTFSRKQALRPQIVSLNVLITDLIILFQRVIGENIHIVTKLEQHLDTIFVDSNQVEQVLLNLVINARDAMERGGTLTIETRNVFLDNALEQFSRNFQIGAYVMVSVNDTGCGIAPEVVRHIFDPFYSTKETGKGTGLGLYIISGIIKQNGGQITVSSEPGKGSNFRIYLPKQKCTIEHACQDVSRHSNRKRSETLLLVENGEIIRKMLLEVLMEAGYTVLDAEDGIDALNVAMEHTGQIDVLITDLIMPRMNGQQLVEKLTESQPLLKVLYISGYAEKDDNIQTSKHMGEFLQKPFRPEQLLKKLRHMLKVFLL